MQWETLTSLDFEKAVQMVALLRAVKADTVTPGLVREFVERKQKTTAPNFWTEAGA